MIVAAFEVGTLGQYLTVIAVIGVAWIIYRGGGSAALGVLETANRVLEARVRELERQQAEDAKMIGELQASRDFALALQPLASAAEHHEARAQARFEGTMQVLDLIAERLGPDNPSDAG